MEAKSDINKTRKLIIPITDVNREIIEEINLARTNPIEYAAKLERFSTQLNNLNKLMVGNEEMYFREGISIFEETIQFLLELKPLPPVENIEGLDESANELLLVMKMEEGVNKSEFSKTHMDLENRLDHFGLFFGEFSEMINYGILNPELIVMNFALCDKDKNRTDRKILFNELFKYIGISNGILPSGKNCTIINFVQYFFKPGETIPQNILNKYINPISFKEKFKYYDNSVLLEKKEQYRIHFEDIPGSNTEKKNIKKTKEIKKKIIDKLTGKEVVVVKKIIFYENGEQEEESYVI